MNDKLFTYLAPDDNRWYDIRLYDRHPNAVDIVKLYGEPGPDQTFEWARLHSIDDGVIQWELDNSEWVSAKVKELARRLVKMRALL